MNKGFERYTTYNISIATLIAALFLLWCYLLMGIRVEHFYILGLILLMYFVHPFSRKLFWYFLPFLVYIFIYDSLRVYPNYAFNEVHIASVYECEKNCFGINSAHGMLTPNEYFAENTHPILDVLSGFFYLSWIPIPIIFGIFLFVTHQRKIGLEFWIAFFMVNMVGFSIYYLYPAAPPWYVDQYGFDLLTNTMGNPAGLSRFDAFFGITLFEDMYSKNASVFAAIPSMHAAYPFILVYFAWKNRMKFLLVLFIIQSVGIWWTAVYSMHHYVIDVLAGIFCVVLGVLFFEWLNSLQKFKDSMTAYMERID